LAALLIAAPMAAQAAPDNIERDFGIAIAIEVCMEKKDGVKYNNVGSFLISRGYTNHDIQNSMKETTLRWARAVGQQLNPRDCSLSQFGADQAVADFNILSDNRHNDSQASQDEILRALFR